MSKFNGKNNMNSIITAFAEKVNYKLNAYEDLENTDVIRDTNFVETVMYGRVDTNLNSVIPIDSFLKPLNNTTQFQTSKNVMAMNFVADAFTDLCRAFQDKLTLGHIPRNETYLSTIMPEKGFEDPRNSYFNYISNIFQIFTNEYIKNNNFSKKIMSINHFIEYFLLFVQRLGDVPITFTSWYRSTNASPFNTGLVINIAAYNLDLDSVKYNEIINSPTFDFYVNTCRQHGFMLSYDNPSLLYADINSIAMKPYKDQYAITNAANLFANQYSMVFDLDISSLDKMFLSYYNIFVLRNRIKREEIYCNLSKKIKNQLIYRNDLDITSYNNIINNKYKLLLYIKLRNIEENYIFPESDIKRIKRRSLFLLKKFDISNALGYVNEEYRSTYKAKPGGINWLSNWLKEKEYAASLED